MKDESLLKLQAAMTDILSVVDGFCRENGIPYSLAYGTALGAVRHGGFIPWDDDVDVFMFRDDYEKFIGLWRERAPEGYSMLASGDEGSIFLHTKIFKDNTVLASDPSDLEKPGHHGFWIDIFPFDKAPTDKKLKKKFMFKAKLRLVYTRDHPFKSGHNKLLELLSRLMLALPKKTKRKIKNKCDAYCLKYRDMSDGYEWTDISAPESLNCFYPPAIEKLGEIDFGGKRFFISEDTDVLLTNMFGDYMTPPPEEERVCRHDPQILIFGDEERAE